MWQLIAVLPNGRLAALDDRSPSTWDLGSGKRLKQFKDTEDKVDKESKELYCVAVSPDGKTLAAGGYYGIILCWDLATGKQTHKLDAGEHVNRLIFTGDGRQLVVLHDHFPRPKLLDLTTGKEVRTFQSIDPEWLTAVALSPDGKTLAGTRFVSGDVYFWDMASGKRRHHWTGDRTDPFNSDVAFSPDGRVLAVTDGEHILLRELSTGRVRQRVAGRAPLAFSPDGKTLVCGSDGVTGLVHRVINAQHP